MNFNTAQMLLQAEDMDWETFPDKETSFGDIRWKIFAGGADSATEGVTFGVCEIDPGGGMKAHHHKLPEFYYILEGQGTIRLDRDVVSVKAGAVVYIPTDMVHGIENTSIDTLALIWMFPTDSWCDVKYSTL